MSYDRYHIRKMYENVWEIKRQMSYPLKCFWTSLVLLFLPKNNPWSHLLDTLTYEQVVNEVNYLKATVAKEIKLKKRITNPLTKKYTYDNLSMQELKSSIRSVISPEETSQGVQIDELLANVLWNKHVNISCEHWSIREIQNLCFVRLHSFFIPWSLFGFYCPS